ncbi:unnamed protein product [Moneuplotes crassus]|uniref:Uncharacterized protein n=1 Tax=Euplotes crassus TaxID=5936 RepID=A0AAD1USU0_EUPCR|nr:unnamed protein product [Moneuplotes crassus]
MHQVQLLLHVLTRNITRSVQLVTVRKFLKVSELTRPIIYLLEGYFRGKINCNPCCMTSELSKRINQRI